MMQTDVKSTNLTASGVVFAGRTRLKSVLFTVTGGTPVNHVKFYDNASGASGTVRVELDASNGSSTYVLIPGEGVLFNNGIYCDIGDAHSMTAFYG